MAAHNTGLWLVQKPYNYGMAYRSILHLIDAEIDRLHQVREMLQSEARLPAKPAAAPGPTLVEDAPPAAQPTKKTSNLRPAPRRMKLRGERKQPILRKRVPMQTALAAAIPAGPVAVSAAAVAARQRVPAQESAPASKPHEAPPGEGTLDALLRDLQARGLAG